jgi:hypothetical protein
MHEGSVSHMYLADNDLRRQINRSVGRALVDREYANRLLSNPALALEDHGCSPQQLKTLRSIRTTDLMDFARQAQARFWVLEPGLASMEENLPPAAAARR